MGGKGVKKGELGMGFVFWEYIRVVCVCNLRYLENWGRNIVSLGNMESFCVSFRFK